MHLPMLFANTYANMQQFDNALAALKLVFDPTATDQTRVIMAFYSLPRAGQ